MWKRSTPPISSPSFPQTMKSPAGRERYLLTPKGSTFACMRILLRDVHDRDLVRADLHRPAEEHEQVERRDEGDQAAGDADVGQRDPRQGPRAKPERDRQDGQGGEPEPQHPTAVARGDVDDERDQAEQEPDRDAHQGAQLLDRPVSQAEPQRFAPSPVQ